eukprot:scpid108469/ scgid17341/ Craniofacial development protein 2; p97 bucentaur protein
MAIRLKFTSTDGSPEWLTIITAYAPTFSSTRSSKDEFFNSLQNVVSKIPLDEKYILLGDFNARVGSGQRDDDWCRIRGPHGVGAVNSSGEELLSFLALHEGWLCNTWFCKKSSLLGTWQHPRSKRVPCID